jgi:hypothetical protein
MELCQISSGHWTRLPKWKWPECQDGSLWLRRHVISCWTSIVFEEESCSKKVTAFLQIQDEEKVYIPCTSRRDTNLRGLQTMQYIGGCDLLMGGEGSLIWEDVSRVTWYFLFMSLTILNFCHTGHCLLGCLEVSSCFIIIIHSNVCDFNGSFLCLNFEYFLFFFGDRSV